MVIGILKSIVLLVVAGALNDGFSGGAVHLLKLETSTSREVQAPLDISHTFV